MMCENGQLTLENRDEPWHDACVLLDHVKSEAASRSVNHFPVVIKTSTSTLKVFTTVKTDIANKRSIQKAVSSNAKISERDGAQHIWCVWRQYSRYLLIKQRTSW